MGRVRWFVSRAYKNHWQQSRYSVATSTKATADSNFPNARATSNGLVRVFIGLEFRTLWSSVSRISVRKGEFDVSRGPEHCGVINEGARASRHFIRHIRDVISKCRSRAASTSLQRSRSMCMSMYMHVHKAVGLSGGCEQRGIYENEEGCDKTVAVRRATKNLAIRRRTFIRAVDRAFLSTTELRHR